MHFKCDGPSMQAKEELAEEDGREGTLSTRAQGFAGTSAFAKVTVAKRKDVALM
jgi:hypothetical protein